VAQGGEVLISEETYTPIKDYVVAVPRTGLKFKGVERNVTVYHITDMA
jgi:class 3 adenylate cyclase